MMMAFLKSFLMLGCPLVVYCKRLFACLWMLVTIRGIYLTGEKTQTCLWWQELIVGVLGFCNAKRVHGYLSMFIEKFYYLYNKN